MESKSETNVIEGLVTHNTTKEGKVLRSPRFELNIGGKKYSTFDPVMVEGLKTGDTVKVDLTKDGEYWQIVGITKVEGVQTPQPNYLGSPKEPTKHMVIENVTGEELRKALNLASEQFTVFATQTHIENGKWYAVIFMR